MKLCRECWFYRGWCFQHEAFVPPDHTCEHFLAAWKPDETALEAASRVLAELQIREAMRRIQTPELAEA